MCDKIKVFKTNFEITILSVWMFTLNAHICVTLDANMIQFCMELGGRICSRKSPKMPRFSLHLFAPQGPKTHIRSKYRNSKSQKTSERTRKVLSVSKVRVKDLFHMAKRTQKIPRGTQVYSRFISCIFRTKATNF